MSRCIHFLLLLLAAPAVAAPVPKVVLSAEQEKEFDRLWDGVGRNDTGHVRLFCHLVSAPDAAVEYLVRHFPRVGLSEVEAKRLLEDLGSEDEKVWRRAYRDLGTRNIRLAMDLETAWQSTSGTQRFRLGALLRNYGNPDDIPTDVEVYSFKKFTGGKVYWQVGEHPRAPRRGNSSVIQYEYEEWAKWMRTCDAGPHSRAVTAVAALARINTPAAKAHLKELADGHSEASATLEAASALKRVSEPTARKPRRPADVWPLDPHAFTRLTTVEELLAHPADTVKLLRAELKPLALTRKEGDTLLKRLLGDDPRDVRAALREVQIFDLRLAMTAEDAWEHADTPVRRGRLVTAFSHWQKLHRQVIGEEFDIDKPHQHFDYQVRKWEEDPETLVCVALKREGVQDGVLTADERDWLREEPGWPVTLAQVSWDRWPKQQSAIYILDAIGTDDAIAIIKDMATGHPDAGPTKAAKDVLKRRGVK